MSDTKVQINSGFVLLTAIFTGGLVIASVLASKIIQVSIFFVPAGVLAYSITFLCTDIVGEVYGKEAARRVVMGGFVALIVVMVLTQLSLYWPAAPFWTNDEGFSSVLGTTQRIIIASLIAYAVSQYTDVWIFAKLRNATNGRFLWLRNNLSTAISQLIDSVIFIVIAFYGVMPVFELILGQWVIKLIIAALDTPLVYAGVAAFRRDSTTTG